MAPWQCLLGKGMWHRALPLLVWGNRDVRQGKMCHR